MNWQLGPMPSPLLINFEFIKVTISMDLTKFFEIFGQKRLLRLTNPLNDLINVYEVD